MTKNPLYNALAASAYIIFIASVMNFGMSVMPKGPDTVLAPIAMISLFTLSAAVMGYLFCYTPLMLYFDKKHKQAAALFLQTVGAFGVLTGIVLALLFSGFMM